MKVKMVESRETEAELSVGRVCGAVFIKVKSPDGNEPHTATLLPSDAVEVYNALEGLAADEEATVPLVNSDNPLTAVYNAHHVWRLFWDKVVVELTPNEARALAWGLQRMVAHVMEAENDAG